MMDLRNVRTRCPACKGPLVVRYDRGALGRGLMRTAEALPVRCGCGTRSLHEVRSLLGRASAHCHTYEPAERPQRRESATRGRDGLHMTVRCPECGEPGPVLMQMCPGYRAYDDREAYYGPLVTCTACGTMHQEVVEVLRDVGDGHADVRVMESVIVDEEVAE